MTQAVPRNILVNLTSTTPGPSQTVPPNTISYVFASDPPMNPLADARGSEPIVVLDAGAEQTAVSAISGDVRWTGCEKSEDGEVWVLQGVQSVKAASPPKNTTLSSLVETFSHTQTFLRDVVDVHRPA